MLSGQPINIKEEDLFERSNFADHIADLLILPENSPSITIALEGEWGTGKSSTINLIKESLRSTAKEAVIVDFNPWLIGSLDSVVEGFLVQFASNINKTLGPDIANKAAGKLLNLAKFLTPIKLIPGVEPWGTLAEKTIQAIGSSTKAAVDMTEFDLSNRKQAVGNAINSLKKSIVVVIDDIDRLPPEEVRIIFQLIKAICDFDRVSYLLAYDPNPVIKCLEYDGTYDGQKYLEKIILSSYRLPRFGYWHLKKYLVKHLDELREKIGITLNGSDQILLNQALSDTSIVRSLATPRDIVRLINRLHISAKNTAGEVNFADVIAFETLELKYSLIAHSIRKEPEIYVGSSLIEGEFTSQDLIEDLPRESDEKNKSNSPIIQDNLNCFDHKDRKNILSILGFLFPKVFESWQPYSEEDAISSNRVSTTEALLRLLHGGATRYTFSSEEVKHFLLSTDDRREILMDYLESGFLVQWLIYVEQFVPLFRATDLVALCHELFNIGRTSFIEKRINLTDSISGLIVCMLKSDKNSSQKTDTINKLAINQISLSISENVILSLLIKCHMWKDGVYKGVPESTDIDVDKCIFEPKELLDIKKAWIKTASSITFQDLLIHEPEPISILFRWGQLSDNNYKKVQEYVELFSNDEQELKAFVNCFPGGKGLNGIEKLVIDVPSFIDKLEKIDNPLSVRLIEYLKHTITKDNGNEEIEN